MRSKEYLLTCLLYWLLWLKVVVKVVVLFTVFFLTASEKDFFFPQLLFYLPFTFCRFAWRSFFYFYPLPGTRPSDPVPSFAGSFTWPLMMSLRGRGGDRQTARQPDSQTATTAEQTGLLVFLSFTLLQ